MTPERAREIMSWYDYQGFGALAYNAKPPQCPRPTEAERTYIWSTGNSGGDTLNSLLWKIIKGGPP
jgi:hypothetical protein